MNALRLGCFALLIPFVGCTREPAPAVPNARPTVLRLGYTPSEEAVADRPTANRALARYLERRLGLSVTLVQTAAYGPAIEAMARGEIDLMTLAPFAYTLAASRQAAEAIVATGTENGGPRTYRSAIVARHDIRVDGLDALRTRSPTLRLNFADAASNSGYLAPHARLVALGLTPERDFATVDFTFSHSVAILNIVHGRADVAGVNDSTLQRLIARKRMRGDDLAVLWRSAPLPHGPMAVRPTLPATFKREIQDALVELPGREPEVARTVMAQFSEPNLVFLRCDDQFYDGLRLLAASMKIAEN